MTEWLKKMCDIPINYGLKHINYLISNAAQIFLNTYGDKLFSLNDVKIEKNECNGDENLFHLYPIALKESTQHLGLNTLNIKSGNLAGVVITTPSLGVSATYSTKITVSSINLTIDIIDASNSLMLMTTTLTAESFKNDHNINNIFFEIKKIILQYLNAICCKVQTITINVVNKITIMILDIFFDNDHFSCREINISKDDIVTKIKDVKFVADKNNLLSIDIIYINSNIIEYLPEIYLENANDDIITTICIVNKMIIDETLMQMDNVEIIISNDEIIISKVKNIHTSAQSIFYDQSKGYIGTFKKKTKTFELNKYVTLTINDVYNFRHMINLMNSFINDLLTKVIVANDDCDSCFFIKNINLMVVSDPHMIELVIDHVCIATNIDIYNLQTKHENMILTCQNMMFDVQNKSFVDLKFYPSDEEFLLLVKKINIDANDISFFDASAKNLSPIISSIANIVTMYQSKFPTTEKSESDVIIRIYESKILHQHMDSWINIAIHQGDINFTKKEIANAKFDIILDEHLLANVMVNHVNRINSIIDSVKIYINPEIFDKINGLLGILNETTDEDKNRASQIMSQTSSANNAREFELYIQKMLQDENAESLIHSIHNLCAAIMDDYELNKLDEIWIVSIPFVHIYLSDGDGTAGFMSIVIKNIKINAYQKNVDDMCYELSIRSLTVIDVLCNNPKNKYFLKNTYEDDVTLSIILDINGNIDNTVKIQIDVRPLTFNINEETLMRLLSFFSNSYKNPQQKESTNIINFCMKALILTVNYYPLNNNDILSLQDCKLLLSSQKITNANGLDELYVIFVTNLKKELNLFNMVQFIPNIKAIQPITSPIAYIYQIINKYFSSQHNKKKLRSIINNISEGTTFASVLIQKRIYQILDIFS
uniref:Uncharacterized protein n=1 Tax=viral metagenome TaxID=1070528 RepID=A0A6C0C6D6_9ZZZZ